MNSATHPREPLRILVVEDDPNLLEVVCRTLESSGHRVTGAGDSTTAVAKAEADRFDLVILDLMLPDCDGVILQGKLNRLSPGLHRRTIFMTGFTSQEPVVQYLRSLSADTIHKPFTARQLLEAVERVR